MMPGSFSEFAARDPVNNGERIERHRLSIFRENFSQPILPTSRKISCLQSRDRVVNEPRAVFSV
jgi:hypothetical protein